MIIFFFLFDKNKWSSLNSKWLRRCIFFSIDAWALDSIFYPVNLLYNYDIDFYGVYHSIAKTSHKQIFNEIY